MKVLRCTVSSIKIVVLVKRGWRLLLGVLAVLLNVFSVEVVKVVSEGLIDGSMILLGNLVSLGMIFEFSIRVSLLLTAACVDAEERDNAKKRSKSYVNDHLFLGLWGHFGRFYVDFY